MDFKWKPLKKIDLPQSHFADYTNGTADKPKDKGKDYDNPPDRKQRI